MVTALVKRFLLSCLLALSGSGGRAEPATPHPHPLHPPPAFVDSGQRLGAGSSWSVALGDLDGDGDLDALVTNEWKGTSAVWLNDGRARFSDSGQDLGQAFDGKLGDLDGDGDLDALVAVSRGDSQVWLNDGRGRFQAGQRLEEGGGMALALGDLDGDGDLDAMIGGPDRGTTVWLNDGGARLTRTPQELGEPIIAGIVLADVDADGDADALVGGWGTPTRVWINDGRGTLVDSGAELTAAEVHVHGMAVGDLDGDGDPDAFMTVASLDDDEVWLNDGSGRFRNTGQPLVSPLGHAVAFGDLDGDGDLDAYVATGSPTDTGDRVWLNDGAGRFTDSGLRLGDVSSMGVALGDLDGDGDLDAFTANNTFGDHTVGCPNRVWLNQGG